MLLIVKQNGVYHLEYILKKSNSSFVCPYICANLLDLEEVRDFVAFHLLPNVLEFKEKSSLDKISLLEFKRYFRRILNNKSVRDIIQKFNAVKNTLEM